METGNILIQDYEMIDSAAYIPWEKLREQSVLITGATGLIGINLVKSILYVSQKRKLHTKVIAFVRNQEKAESIFADEMTNSDFHILCGSLELPVATDEKVDYIIHGASNTSSAAFMNSPVEVIHAAVNGTCHLLDFAKQNEVKGFVFLSTMEVYGHPEKETIVTEQMTAGFDPKNPRNSYPISKQLCESLCMSYASEYHVPAKCVRLTQTFGPGVAYDDGRIFAEFMRCAVRKNDIVLKTKGETERCYLYTADSVTAILTVLLKGASQDIYNAANPGTYCSIRGMAELVAHEIAADEIQVRIELDNIEKYGYANTLYMQLDVSKLMDLGWKPLVALKQMYIRMIDSCCP